MNDLFSIINELLIGSYKVAGYIFLICFPVKLLLSAFKGKLDLR